MFATAFHTSRHYILLTVMACLSVLLGGPSYAAGADSLFIAGDTYCEPGLSGPGWAWTDYNHLELTGYAGEAIGTDGDLVVTLVGQNSVVETHAPDADISMSGMEVWGEPYASRLRLAHGDGFAMRDPCVPGAGGGRLHGRSPGRWGRRS